MRCAVESAPRGAMTDGAGERQHRPLAPPVRRTKKSAKPREVELKYLVRDLEALRSWLARDWGGALDGVEAGDERDRRGRGSLRRHRLRGPRTGRLRGSPAARGGGPVTVTVKSTSHDRPVRAMARPATRTTRWRSRSASRSRARRTSAWTPTLWPASAARELINEVRAGARLRTLFTINQRRERRTLAARRRARGGHARLGGRLPRGSAAGLLLRAGGGGRQRRRRRPGPAGGAHRGHRLRDARATLQGGDRPPVRGAGR